MNISDISAYITSLETEMAQTKEALAAISQVLGLPPNTTDPNQIVKAIRALPPETVAMLVALVAQVSGEAARLTYQTLTEAELAAAVSSGGIVTYSNIPADASAVLDGEPILVTK